MIEYIVRLADFRRHLFEVDCCVDAQAGGTAFEMASWIPGSYLLREYARHVVTARAFTPDGSEVAVEKTTHNTWFCSEGARPLIFRLQIYALDESVRGAWLDARRAYFNGPCLFARPLGHADIPVRLVVEAPPAQKQENWRVATSMKPVDVDERGFGAYSAEDYDDLLDQPFEIGDFDRVEFDVNGTPHALVVAGTHDGDVRRVADDLQRLCATQIDFFGGQAPFDRYVFLGIAVSEGYGGLEHHHCSSLMFARDDLPGVRGSSEKRYQRLLSLASHEYFHAWHVKRTRPAALLPYRLTERNYTRLLWVFEGITSYYQDRFLLRSGLIDAKSYLARLAATISNVLRVPGRYLQSLADSSFDAWDKLYKPESNSVNAGVSYYSKGAMVALALDLEIRVRHASRVSLDTVVQALWEQYGARGIGVSEDGFEALAQQIAGPELGGFFDAFVRGTEDPPLAQLLATFGIDMRLQQQRNGAQSNDDAGDGNDLWLGVAQAAASFGITCSAVYADGPAQNAGINPGDRIIALDRRCVSQNNLAEVLRRFEHGSTVEVLVLRGDEVLDTMLTLERAPAQECVMTLIDDASEQTLQLRRAWLHEQFEA